MNAKRIYGDCEGPFGFPMKSEVARALEKILASLDADCKGFLAEQPNGIARRRQVPAAMELQPGERADISIVTTDAVDLDGEVVAPEGGDWSHFAKGGGRVTWAHHYDELDVGRCLWMVRTAPGEPNGWKAKTVYHSRPGADVLPEGQPWPPDVVNYYVQELGLKGKSIGFVPTSMRAPTKADIAARPQLAKAARYFPTWLGLEYAVAPIRSNPDAVVQMVSKGRAAGFPALPLLLQEFGVVIPDGAPAPQPKAEPPPAAVVTRADVARAIARARQEVISDIPAMVRETVDALRGRI